LVRKSAKKYWEGFVDYVEIGLLQIAEIDGDKCLLLELNVTARLNSSALD
jgi:hypothetical protein